MADTDDLKQIVLSAQEQSRQQHAELMARFDTTDRRIAENEKATDDLRNATKAFVEHTGARFTQVEGRLEGVERKLVKAPEHKQLPATTGTEPSKDPLTALAEGFVEGFTLKGLFGGKGE